MLSDYLFEEIIEISKNGKLIDKDLLKKIVIDLISKSDDLTRTKFNKINFVKESKFWAMAYPPFGEIEFCLNNMYKDLNSYKNISMLTKNLEIIAITLHEIEHLREIDKIFRNTYQGKLIKLSLFEQYNLLNKKIYCTDPSEKIAYAMSFKRLLNYLSHYPNFKKEHFKEYIYIYNGYIDRLKYGYEKSDNGKYNIPLVHFLRAINKLSRLTEVGFKLVKKGEAVNLSKMSLEKKFMYGFPIKEEEMKKLESKKILIKKK